MATETKRATIDRQLHNLLEDADELAEVLAEWEEISESEQDIWLYGWPNSMAKAERLERAYRAGEMTFGQRRLHEDLKVKLREISPALERVGLRVPSELLEETA